MISQAAVDRIADELLEQARTRKFGFTDPSGMPVPLLYRCREMQALPQGLQQEIVDRATRETASNLWFIPIMFGAIAVVFLAAILLYVLAPTLTSTRMLPFILPAAAPLLPILFRASMTRIAVKRIASQMVATWPVPVHM